MYQYKSFVKIRYFEGVLPTTCSEIRSSGMIFIGLRPSGGIFIGLRPCTCDQLVKLWKKSSVKFLMSTCTFTICKQFNLFQISRIFIMVLKELAVYGYKAKGFTYKITNVD